MTATTQIAHRKKLPTRKDAFVFRGKTVLFQIRRAASDMYNGRLLIHSKSSIPAGTPVIATSRTPLWTETERDERFLVAGKIQNLRIAAAILDGVTVPAGETFSFWNQVGRTTRIKGFVAGRELREGCIIPSIGGGLCQISNALFDAAVQAKFEIVERHAHTQVIAGSLAEMGRDATVFWNYVDLRFRSEHTFRIEAKLDKNDLIVRFRSDNAVSKKLYPIRRATIHNDGPNSCTSCGEGDCRRVIEPKRDEFGRSAFLLDEFTPEFDQYITATHTKNDRLFLPLKGRTFRKANYAWTAAGYDSVYQSMFVTAKRSYASRKLAAQGSARQVNLLKMYELLACSYERRLSFDVLHLTIQQNLLPFLWKSGILGGRTFDVLMNALPMTAIQTRLDHAASLHPESTTLGDFRADPALVDAEAEALAHANRIITPHTDIAALFPGRAAVVAWKKPTHADRQATANSKPHIVFPAATVGRKGCYELREALDGMDVKLVLLGPIIEHANFWDGLDTEKGGENWIQNADIVALPAFIEHRPRRLLAAASAGIPVVASHACGIGNVSGIEPVEAGNSAALRTAILASIQLTGK